MEKIAELMFWAGLIAGFVSLTLLWWMRRNELDDQRSKQQQLQIQQEELRAEIVDLKAMLRPHERISE